MAAAQRSLQYTRLSAEDGLSNNSVQCILQDKSGIIWIGTNGGLNRYDGSSFVQYSILSKPALTNSTVTALMEDERGNIWVGTENGLNILNPVTNTIRQFAHIDAVPASIPSGPIRVIQKMKEGGLWILSDRWIVKFNNASSFVPVSIDTALIQNDMVFTAITDQAPGEYWISYLDKVTVLAKRTQEGAQEKMKQVLLTAKDTSKMYIDAKNTTWSISSNSIKRFNNTSRTFENWVTNTYAPKSPNLHLHSCYTIDADGNIWQSNEQAGLMKYDLVQKQVTDYSWVLKAVNATLAYCVYKDNSNNIWVGTDNGIIKVSNRTSVFKNVPFTLKGTELKNIRCRRITATRNNVLYAATENYGLLKLMHQPNGADTTIGLSTFGATPISDLPFTKSTLKIPLNGRYDIGYMYDMWYDGNDEIWMAGFGISRLNTRTDSLQVFLVNGDEKTRYESINQFSICYDGTILWTGGQHNLYTFDPLTELMEPFVDNKGNMPFREASCWSLARQRDWLWAGTYKGLYKVNIRTREVQKVSIHPVLEAGINDIQTDGDSSIWISTAGGGILHYTEHTGQIDQYTNKDGLSNNTVCGLLPDNHGNLWISTYAGLSYFDRQAKQFTNFYTKDGLNTDEFNRKAFSRLSDGRMIFGGMNGYTIFNPEDAFKRDKPVNMLLTRFSKISSTGETIETVFDIGKLKQVTINPGDKFFSFHFTLTDMYDPPGNRYFYQVQGLDNVWHSIGNQNNVSFNGLPAGRYTLKIKGNLGKGSASVNDLSVDILVKQVFYKTAWFIVLVFISLAIVIYSVVRYRINQVKKILNLRTRIASDLHDEVGSSLVHITILADAVKREKKKENVAQQLVDIAGISRGAVSTMKDVIWSIDARNDTMAGMINHMHDHIHTMLAPANIESGFTQKGLTDNEKLHGDFRQNVYLVFKEAINNIVKHSGATQVLISLEKENGIFIMKINDDGKGIDPDHHSSGQGLSNMHMRAKRLRGTIDIRSENGVTVLLKVPV
jgi:ligand-binding sensor domain-containing protein/two-component sensor histidine kinase